MMSVSRRPLHRAYSLRDQVGPQLPDSLFMTALGASPLPSWKASDSRGPRAVIYLSPLQSLAL